MIRSDICLAIRERRVLEFSYRSLQRSVAPYCHGFNKEGAEVLRAVQVSGASLSGGLGFGKLWTVSQIVELRVSSVRFLPNDPDYNPEDRAMARIHCRV